jgi:hypothetical protein
VRALVGYLVDATQVRRAMGSLCILPEQMANTRLVGDDAVAIPLAGLCERSPRAACCRLHPGPLGVFFKC